MEEENSFMYSLGKLTWIQETLTYCWQTWELRFMCQIDTIKLLSKNFCGLHTASEATLEYVHRIRTHLKWCLLIIISFCSNVSEHLYPLAVWYAWAHVKWLCQYMKRDIFVCDAGNSSGILEDTQQPALLYCKATRDSWGLPHSNCGLLAVFAERWKLLATFPEGWMEWFQSWKSS